MTHWLRLCLASSLPWQAPAHAQPATSDYHLFNPVPVAEMREMSTDRPDTTESPYTVDAGHVQLEMSFFDYERDFDRGTRTETWIAGQANLKFGLAPDVDLQLVVDLYGEERTWASGGRSSSSGFGDVTLRLKKNLWGNDGGKTALALMPYLTIPTGAGLSGDRWAGGLIVPLGVALSDRVALGVMAELDVVPDTTSNGYDLQFLHSATLGFAVTDQFGVYTELVGIAGGGGTEYQALFNSGITLSMTDNLMFDAGVRIGLNRAAPEFGIFTGMSVRF